jgi:1-aminocyclopropane-1-carboxylate deaminase
VFQIHLWLYQLLQSVGCNRPLNLPKSRIVKYPAFVFLCPMESTFVLFEDPIHLELLRLDLKHPYSQGNKWFKLKYNFEKAIQTNHDCILTFGGPWSNHLHATALEAREKGFKAIGIVRGEEPKKWSPTLLDCKEAGMQLHFISRAEYSEKEEPFFKAWLHDIYGRFYLIPEGGSNFLGVNGCMEILDNTDEKQGWICCAAGTGATSAGIALSLKPHQKLLVFPVMGDGGQIDQAIRKHLFSVLMDWDAVEESMEQVEIDSRWSFGGFGKTPSELNAFMLEFQQQYHIELDRVYTAKMMFGLLENIKEGKFMQGENVLAIHTGGTQGNRELDV